MPHCPPPATAGPGTRRASAAGRPRGLARAAIAALLFWLACVAVATAFAQPAPPAVQDLTQAVTIAAEGDRFPAGQSLTAVRLPDDWARSRPDHNGSLWYETGFDLADGVGDELLALYIERACSSVDVQLNGHWLLRNESAGQPMTRNCEYPRLITLPTALLKPQGNVLDLRLNGQGLARVSARERAGGLSALRIGPQSVLAREHAQRTFWSVHAVQNAAIVLAVIGCIMLGVGSVNRRQVYLLYFGGLLLGWAVLWVQPWLRQAALAPDTVEWLASGGNAVLLWLAVEFLLTSAGLRSRLIERLLWLQCLLMPLSLVLAGPQRMFLVSSLWFAVFFLQAAAAALLHLRMAWHHRRRDFWPTAALLGGAALVLLVQALARHDRLGLAPMEWLQFLIPLLLLAMSLRLLQLFSRALHAAEAGRSSLEHRVREATAQIERNFAQLAELRVEQVTEKERKRIAADLHDDLGAKLLTIVHTSESERISTLAREALEEMRLSVRGLTGKPMRLADALADWRAETVLRLGQANIEADWRSPPEDVEQLLPARGFVQTTRILREAVSNIIKHSGATQCKVRCAVTPTEFGLVVQDNGKGIPMELDGKLDRGHGMSSMKHRAKQMQGQCLVESGPGYGTVIRLTLPL